jgi:hypothetical protein
MVWTTQAPADKQEFLPGKMSRFLGAKTGRLQGIFRTLEASLPQGLVWRRKNIEQKASKLCH